MASMAALAVLAARSEGRSGSTSSNPLRDRADACLEGLEVTARMEAMLAARKVRFAAGFANVTRAMSPPDEQPHQRLAREMGVVAEVACALTVSERSASALLAESHELTTTLPLTQAALEQGLVSWQHARVMVDEAASLDPAGAAALEAHFLDPDAPHPARWCPAGDMVPSRFRHKARIWRERHHPESIEKRHARSVLDRRLEYAPDRDGMAWLSAYLPADQAAGIWNGITATARALQGPTEARTLTQLRADVAAKLLLSAGFTTSSPTDGSTETAAGDTDTAAGGNTDAAATSTSTSDDGVAGGVPVTDGVDHVVAGLVPAIDGVDSGRVPSPAAQVLVTVPVFALMGLTDEPADLDGYGPIPASMARKLVADGASSFRRVLIDPRDGAPLEIGRDSYRIPAAMRQWLQTPGREMFVPRLQQPVPGQRSRPHPRLGRRRHHRHLQSRVTVPQTPPAQTHHSVDTHHGHQRRTARLDLTHRPPLHKANTTTGNHPTGHPKSRTSSRSWKSSSARILVRPCPTARQPMTPR